MLQTSVIVENKPGSLARVTSTLSRNQINIRAISAFDSPDFCIMRLILNRPEEGKKVLREAGFSATNSQVIAVELEDRPGDLDRVLGLMAEARINLNYIYSFVLRGQEEPLMIFNVDKKEEAEAMLRANGVKIVTELN